MNELGVSVIVPVRDRREMLGGTLKALAGQSYRDFEVVVVDDGSTDGSGAEAEAAAQNGFRVRVVRTAGVGAVEARRIGVASSTGSILAFTDSDCLPDPAWLEKAVAAFSDGVDLVQGRTEPVRDVGLLERTVWVTREDGLYATCNVLYRRDAFERAGGFHDAGRLLGFRPGVFGRALGFGEDVILGWKIARAGRARFVPEAIVRHEVIRPTVREILRRAWMAGAFPPLVREIPELRRTQLQDRLFLGRRRIPLYATLAAIMLRRPGLAAVAALWWVAARARQGARVEREPVALARGVAVELACDVVTAAALIAGSARARNVVL
jgi:glycosyltransferase involved in cell wall biosynthesis